MVAVAAARAAARGRERAESLMRDSCRVVREGELVWNPVTKTNDVAETELYAGKCRVRPQGGRGGDAQDAGGALLAKFPVLVSVPFTTTGIGLEDIVHVVTSADPDLVGARLRVQMVDAGTDITARRLGCVRESR